MTGRLTELSWTDINISVSLQFLFHLTLLSLLSLATGHLTIPKEHQWTTGWKWPNVSSCPALQPQGLSPARLLCPWESPGKNTGVGRHSLLQRIFPVQVLFCFVLFFQSRFWTQVSCIAGRFFTVWAIKEALFAVYKVISYNACAAQMFFFAAFATLVNYFLTSVACVHYAAVCKPLNYTTTMTPRVCAHLIIGYVCGFLKASIHVGNTFCLSICRPNVVHHFFCAIPAIMALSCSDRHVRERVPVYVASFNIFFVLLVIFTAYIFIFITVLKMHSSARYQKALSTCVSHLTELSVFYGALIFMYLEPSSRHLMDTDKWHLCSTVGSPPRSILWSLAWGTRKSRVPSRRFFSRQNCRFVIFDVIGFMSTLFYFSQVFSMYAITFKGHTELNSWRDILLKENLCPE